MSSVPLYKLRFRFESASNLPDRWYFLFFKIKRKTRFFWIGGFLSQIQLGTKCSAHVLIKGSTPLSLSLKPPLSGCLCLMKESAGVVSTCSSDFKMTQWRHYRQNPEKKDREREVEEKRGGWGRVFSVKLRAGLGKQPQSNTMFRLCTVAVPLPLLLMRTLCSSRHPDL